MDEMRAEKNKRLFKFMMPQRRRHFYMFDKNRAELWLSIDRYMDYWDGISIIIGGLDQTRALYAFGCIPDEALTAPAIVIGDEVYREFVSDGGCFNILFDCNDIDDIEFQDPPFSFSEDHELPTIIFRGDIPEVVVNSRAINLVTDMASKIWKMPCFVELDSEGKRLSVNGWIKYIQARNLLVAVAKEVLPSDKAQKIELALPTSDVEKIDTSALRKWTEQVRFTPEQEQSMRSNRVTLETLGGCEEIVGEWVKLARDQKLCIYATKADLTDAKKTQEIVSEYARAIRF